MGGYGCSVAWLRVVGCCCILSGGGVVSLGCSLDVFGLLSWWVVALLCCSVVRLRVVVVGCSVACCIVSVFGCGWLLSVALLLRGCVAV